MEQGTMFVWPAHSYARSLIFDPKLEVEVCEAACFKKAYKAASAIMMEFEQNGLRLRFH